MTTIPKFTLPILLAFALAPPAGADTYERQAAVDVLHYDIAIELGEPSDAIGGDTRLQVMLRSGGISRIWLDLDKMMVDSVSVGRKDRPFIHSNGRLSFDLDRAYQKGEIAEIEVRYHGKAGAEGILAGKNKYGQHVYFAENWPDRAHCWFPSIDHPSDKATMEMDITTPAGFEIVAPGRWIETRILDGGKKSTRWREAIAIPTYCMVFGAADFAISQLQEGVCPPLTVYSYRQDIAAAAQKFARTPQILKFFAGLLGPFPYEKLAQVESTTRLGGMENASAIFYVEGSFQTEPVTESPVAHEIAHQWFGDSVTAADWDHLWLSEGFATYCDALFYEQIEGREALNRTMLQAAEKIRAYQKIHPGPIIDPTVKNLVEKLNPYNYQKGAWVLHMLRKITGDRAFFQGLRRFYETYKDGIVLSDDFRTVMESAAGMQLGTFFHQWLYLPGWPEFRVSWNWLEKTTELELKIEQVQKTGLFDMPVEVVIQAGSSRIAETLRVSRSEDVFRIPLAVKPVSVEVDPDNWVLKTLKKD